MNEKENQIQEFMMMQQKQSEIEKTRRYSILNKYAKKGQIVFVGSSLCELFPINEMIQNIEANYIIYNRGIAGDVTDGLLTRMDECIFQLEPSKIFINIGTNDIGFGVKVDEMIKKYDDILNKIKTKLPKTRVYLLSYYPSNSNVETSFPPEIKEMMFCFRTKETIDYANKQVIKLANKYDYQYIDVSTVLTNENGELKEEYATDGIHMWPNAYLEVLKILEPYFR